MIKESPDSLATLKRMGQMPERLVSVTYEFDRAGRLSLADPARAKAVANKVIQRTGPNGFYHVENDQGITRIEFWPSPEAVDSAAANEVATILGMLGGKST